MTTEMINQKDFLKNMGIDTRLLMLLRKAKTAEGKGFLMKQGTMIECGKLNWIKVVFYI